MTTWDQEHGVEIRTRWDRYREVTPEQAAELKPEVLAFISDPTLHVSHLMTRRRDGRELMRPVATFVEDWVVGTITQDVQPKTSHVRNDPVVGYLWLGREDRLQSYGTNWNPRSVWMQGRAELVEDQAEVAAFYERRGEALGMPRTWPPEDVLYLIRVIPEYVRAEGWAGAHAIVYRDFPEVRARN